MSLEEKVSNFPLSPGVYLMKGEGEKVIYVGKAKSLRTRVRNYFHKEGDGRFQIQFLMRRVKDIDYLVCNNEKEALLLENSLIKKHKPRYNIFLKDDKSYVSLKIQTNHPFPSLSVTRHIKKDGALYFGPYSSAEACREIVDFIYKNFQLRTCSDHELSNRSRPCLEYQIRRCTAPCVGYVSEPDYQKQVEPVRLLLEGRNQELVQSIKNRMAESSSRQDFERAAHYRDILKSLEGMLEKQSVVKHGGVHQDLIVFYREEDRAIIAVLNVREGTMIDSHFYPVPSLDEDTSVVENFISQYYLSIDFIPDEILVSVPDYDLNALADILSERKGKKVEIRAPQKGEKRKLIEFAEMNARSQFARLVRKELTQEEILKKVQGALGLPHLPRHMECYDISNISGTLATASGVVFVNGLPDKNLYRHYKIRLPEGPNDYAMMKEVLERRLVKITPSSQNTGEEDNKDALAHVIPDLLIVDGGKGQLNIALTVLEELNLQSIPVIGIAKGQGQGARSKGLWAEKKEEEIYLPHRKNPVILKRGSAELMLLQRIRDESHRFALKYHQKLRDKKMRKSFLDPVKGLGPSKKRFLYEAFKSEEGIKAASVEDLMGIKGITKGLAEEIKKLV